MKKIYTGKIPFKYFEIGDKKYWRQLDYFNNYTKDVIMKDNSIFTAKIQISSYSRGMSAANWAATILGGIAGADEEFMEFLPGCVVNIFMTDMLDIILHNNLFSGTSNYMRLAFCKRGKNYGLCLVDE